MIGRRELLSKALQISPFFSSSKSISTFPPVFFVPNNRAGITFVLLKTRQSLGFKKSCILEILLCFIDLYHQYKRFMGQELHSQGGERQH